MDDVASRLRDAGDSTSFGDVARGMRDWYGQLHQRSDTWRIRRGRARANERIAEALAAEGNQPAALEALAQASELLMPGLDDPQTREDAALRLALLDRLEGHAHARMGRSEEASARLDSAAERLRGVLAEMADDDERREDVMWHLARVEADHGEFLFKRSDERAFEHLDRAIALHAERHALGERHDRGLVSAHLTRARLQFQLGRVGLAMRDVERGLDGIAAIEAFHKRERSRVDTEVESFHGSLLDLAARLHRAAGHVERAHAMATAGLALRRRLLLRDPDLVERRAEYAASHLELGRQSIERRQVERARAHLSKALEIFASLAASEPDNVDHAFDHAVALHARARVSALEADYEEALGLLDRQVRALEHVLARNPRSVRARHAHVLAVESRHADLWSLGRLDEARAAADDAVERARALVVLAPTNGRWRELLARALVRVAAHRCAVQRHAEAPALFREAIGIWDDLLAADPDDVGMQRRRAMGLANLASALAMIELPAEAARAMTRAQHLARDLPALAKDRSTQAVLQQTATLLARVAAGAPFRSGARQPETREDHAAMAYDLYEREVWVAAADAFERALGVPADAASLPSNVDDLLPAIRAAAQAATRAPDRSDHWHGCLLAWVRCALDAAPTSDRAQLGQRILRDPYLGSVRAEASVLERLRALIEPASDE